MNSPALHPHPDSRRGSALLLVLACLLLITTLIVGLLLTSQSNLRSSKLYADGASVKTLADSTVSLVMAQIQQATSNGTTVAWASQPGMIRTYDNAGNPYIDYRLYSWDSPTWNAAQQGPYNPSTDAGQLTATGTSAWYNSPAVFTDLNQPIIDSSGTPHFQIIDGNDADLGTANVATTTGTAEVKTYLNTATTPATPAIEGFWVNQNNGPAVTTESSITNDIPMPVKWLYVLRDGTIVSPQGSGTQVTLRGASSSNPVTGRIAYWTDDETAKVNINTASEGNYWDTPHAQGITDFAMADFQPCMNEFQRYPGHPATTCLSTVLGAFLPQPEVDHTLAPSIPGAGYSGSDPTVVYGPYQPYYDLSPELNLDTTSNLGSQAGTVANYTGGPLTAKTDRLYASVDELLFKSNLFADSNHSTTFASTGRTTTNPNLTGTMLEKMRFFLTTSSRAPDVNLFNQPRVLTWPINATNSAAYRTPLDQAIAFCGTINGLPYYFQRQKNDDQTNDLPAAGGSSGLGRNRELIQYLKNLTSQPIPGFGAATFADKYPVVGGVSGCDQILTEIFDYIRCLNLMDQSTPAMTNPFTAASPGEVVPILDTVTKTRGFGRFPTVQEASLVFIATGWNDGKGGTNPNDVNYQVSQDGSLPPSDTPAPSVPFPWGYYNADTSAGFPVTNPPFPGVPLSSAQSTIPPGNIQVQAMLLLSLYDPAQGRVNETYKFQIQVLGLESLKWNGATMGFGNLGGDTFNNIQNGAYSIYTVQYGGNTGFRELVSNAFGPYAFYYPFIGTPQNFPYNTNATKASQIAGSAFAGTFNFSGGPITINILPGSANATATPLQTITVTFPPATLPIPTYAPPAQDENYSYDNDRGLLQNRLANTINNHSASSEFTWGLDNGSEVRCGDVVRSIRAYPGDMRIIAALPSINTGTASPSGALYYDDGSNLDAGSDDPIYKSGLTSWNYSSQTSYMVHSLQESLNLPFYGSILGQMVPQVSYCSTGTPASGGALLGTSGSSNTFYPSWGWGQYSGQGGCAGMGAYIGGGSSGSPGDWDNGFSFAADGGMINKADEGDWNLGASVPYFGDASYGPNSTAQNYQTMFSPNRLMPGPGQFGSLSTGVIENIPWKTLLFCANPAAGPSHPGFGRGAGTAGPSDVPPYQDGPSTKGLGPPDHLLLDLFNMPVVEPYPISEPLSTAGRINMNYQIVPFTYIKRSTGLRAVLKSERMTVIPDFAGNAYKSGSATSIQLNKSYDYRVPINADQTLLGFDAFFDGGDIFRSATQICNMFLYPDHDAPVSSAAGSGPKWDANNANILNFWNGNTSGTQYSVSTSSTATHYLTGDNSRERPYTTVYPRLTTKSNTYTIHYTVETLKQALPPGAPDSAYQTWREGVDTVTGTYRGSTIIERYIDPNDTRLPDFTQSPTVALDNYYKFRVVSDSQFAP
ncbi:MAG: Verru_Chthon cassette protein A [Verrucomicrobiota bacterium]